MAANGGGAAGCLRAARWVVALLCGTAWWWAAIRLALHPGRAGPIEGAMLAGGWGLSLLPVHCVPRTPSGAGRPDRVGLSARQVPGGRGPGWQRGHQ
ncbi:hypothetical protein ACZ90_16915 [Streptomyces albus subsp. albus]|nr:hypothetical protein ACZ90_16915 [Streptomyces albus subsp. albus]